MNNKNKNVKHLDRIFAQYVLFIFSLKIQTPKQGIGYF